MRRVTDCDRGRAVRSWPAMRDFADLNQRIDALCARASSEERDARLLVEIEDLLAEGYICALHGDHRTRRLQTRLDELLADADAADAAHELQSVARERRMIHEATQELRTRLAVMRSHWVALGSDRLGLA
jgi:hypothetical protein